jgi:hypothetical protein
MSYILSVGLFFLSLTTTYIIHKHEKSWFVPSSILSLLFTFVLGLSLLFAPDFYFSPLALLYILSTIITFFIGGLFIQNSVEYSKSALEVTLKSIKLNNKILITVILSGTFIGFISIYFLLTTTGTKLSSFLSLSEFIEVASKLSVLRYSEVPLSTNIIFFLTLNYTSLIFSGVFFVLSTKIKYKIISIFPLVPVLLFTLIYTARVVFLNALIFFFISILATKVLEKSDHIRLFSRKKIMFYIVGLISIFILFLITQIARYDIKDVTDFKNISYITLRLRIWFFGNVSGFSVWFDSFYSNSSPFWGQYTFGGLFELFGIGTRKLGIFDVVPIGHADEKTNVFSLCRILIEDFSIWGTYLVCFFAGLFSKFIYYKTLKQSVVAFIILAAIYSEIFWSPIASFLYYNSSLFTFFFALIIFRLIYLVIRLKT